MRSAICSANNPLLFPYPSQTGLLLACLLLLISGQAVGGLLAPVYPGAVHAPEYDSGKFEVWLSPDPPEKVSAWYRKALGREPEHPIGKHDWFPVLTAKEVWRIFKEAGRNPHWAFDEETVGVDVRYHPLAAHVDDVEYTRAQMGTCTSDHFMILRDLIARGMGSEADFNRLCEKYGWIEHAFYRLHDPDGLRQPMDKYLLAEDKKRLTRVARASAADAEALGRRVQELVMQGRFKEAGKLMESLQGAHGASAELPNDAWEQWVQHLEKVAHAAYRTWIRIHKHPLEWSPER
ncbi:MAG: hypothetical protein D6791_11970 [Chloroflexi bacterium]|nr:MAG: hypothetical protein D6791_11970 [Chloroflexota bacterium]